MKARILSCSMELFGRLGIKGLTMDDIAANLGISKRTLYEHFNCKEALLAESLQLHLENCKLFTATSDSLIDELVALYVRMHHINLANAYRFCQELQKYYAPTYQMLLEELSDYASACGEKVPEGINEGYLRNDIRPNMVYTVVTAYLVHLFSCVELNYKERRWRLSPEIIILFTRGLCTIKGRNYLDKKIKELAL